MLQLLRLTAIFLLIPTLCFGAVSNVKEQDGSPDLYPWQLRVPNGTLTDNGDGSASLTTGGGSGSGDVVGPSSAVDSNFAAFDTTTGKLIKDSGSSSSTFATAAQGGKADTAIQTELDPIVASQTNGFTITRGTTPATLTVAASGSVSGTNTGDNAANSTADMLLGTVQAVTAEKKFTKDKITMLGTSTGKNIISTANTTATDYTNILPAKDGTFAMTVDITGTNSGTNTGDNAANSTYTIGSQTQAYNSYLTGINQALTTTSSPFFTVVTAALSGNATTATSATSASTATTATNATNITTADDTTTNSDYYPTFQTATAGTNPLKTSSSKLTFHPSTGLLTATGFSGPLTGNVTGNCSGSSGSTTGNAATVTTNANLTGPVTSTGNATVFHGTKTFTITNPTAAKYFKGVRFASASTITSVHLNCSGNVVVGQLWQFDSNGVNGAVVDSSNITGVVDTNVNDDGALSAPSITANNYVGWHTTSVTGTPTYAYITFDYTTP